MKILRWVLIAFCLTYGLLFLVSCQGPNMFAGQLKNKVSIALAGYSKKISTSASSRSLSPAIVQHMSKQAFLASRNPSASPRLIHPDTYYYEIIVSAPDIETIDEIYFSSGNGIGDFLDLYVPAGYARSFVINLWASDFYTNLGSTEVVSDVVISPTYIDALIPPNNAAIPDNVTISNISIASPAPYLMTDLNWNIVHFNFGTIASNVAWLNMSAAYINPNSYFLAIPFDVTGNQVASQAYVETPVDSGGNYQLSVLPQTSFDSLGTPINNTDLYLLIYSPAQTISFFESQTYNMVP